jgi:tetratricopeptide repeat protein 21B
MNMIEIFLNPDNSELFAESTEAKGDNTEHIRNAETLIRELRLAGDVSPKLVVLEAYALMATKVKADVEKSVSILTDLLAKDRDYVPGLLGLANALILQNMHPKARNHLKRVKQLPLDPEFAAEFEKSWLLLADMYIQQNKPDMATELCKKTLANNQSSAKAWEHQGLIMMKTEGTYYIRLVVHLYSLNLNHCIMSS